MAVVYNDYINQAKKYYSTARNEAKAAEGKIYDERAKVVNDTYNKQISDTKIAYDDLQRENAIQKLINENEIAEDMANMGLSDSGLNRTQQTAVQLSYANNRAGINRQKQANLDVIAQNLASELSAIKQNRIASLSAIDKEYDSAVASMANEGYRTALNAEAKINTSLEQQNQSEPFILTFKGVTKTNDSGEKIRVYTDASGKKYEAKVGYNPYTGDNNAGSKRAATYGFFKENGYQPKGIVDIDGTDYGALNNTGIPSYITGKKQNIWSSTDKNGTEHYWLWSGVENAYVEMYHDKNTDSFIATNHKVYF